MDPNHIQNFCGNMFSLTGRQIDALRQILSGTVQSNNLTADTLTDVTSNTQWGQFIAIFFVMIALYLSFRETGRHDSVQDTTHPEKSQHNFHNDNHDNHRGGGDGGTST